MSSLNLTDNTVSHPSSVFVGRYVRKEEHLTIMGIVNKTTVFVALPSGCIACSLMDGNLFAFFPVQPRGADGESPAHPFSIDFVPLGGRGAHYLLFHLTSGKGPTRLVLEQSIRNAP